MIDQDMATKTWIMGDAFTMADCAAAPALFYANMRDALRRHAQEPRGLPRAPDGTSVLRPSGEGSPAVPGTRPEVERIQYASSLTPARRSL